MHHAHAHAHAHGHAQVWLSEWARSLSASKRCVMLLLVFGAVAGDALNRRICVLPSAGASATFVPETSQIYVPMACSAQELALRMDSSLCL